MRFLYFISVLSILHLAASSTHGVKAQTREQQGRELLKNAGFESIRLFTEGPVVYATIERGLHRSAAKDLRAALLQISSLYPDSCQYRLLLLEQGHPVYELQARKRNGETTPGTNQQPEAFPFEGTVDYYVPEHWEKLKEQPVTRKVSSGVSLTLYPQIALRNIHVDQFYEEQYNLAPMLQYSAWRGMQLSAQLIVPLYNEWGYQDDFVRPGFVTFSQQIWLAALNELRFTAGNFNNNSYGLDLRWKKHFRQSRWKLGANAGLTGSSYFYDNYWKHSALSRFTASVSTGYYIPKYDLQADVQLGRFLAGDHGVRTDIYRYFGEVTIGVYAGYTEKPYGGFHFAIPVDPFKRRHASRFRVVLPATYDNEYNASSEVVYGRYYEIRPDENRSIIDLHPQYLNKIVYKP